MTPDQRSRLGVILLVVGPVLIVLGALGLIMTRDVDGGEITAPRETTSPDGATSPPGGATPTRTPSETTTVEPTSTPEPSVLEEDVRRFVEDLAEAIREGDERFLLDRLHPAVLERYGVDQCEQWAVGIQDDTHGLDVQQVGEPGSWDYRTDERTTTIEVAFPLDVVRTSGEQQTEQRIHVAAVDGQLRWFTDCGDPLT